MRLEPPELVSVPVVLWLVPSATLPKPRLNGAAVKEPGVTPVPERGTLSVGLEASLVIATVALAAPLD